MAYTKERRTNIKIVLVLNTLRFKLTIFYVLVLIKLLRCVVNIVMDLLKEFQIIRRQTYLTDYYLFTLN